MNKQRVTFAPPICEEDCSEMISDRRRQVPMMDIGKIAARIRRETAIVAAKQKAMYTKGHTR